jgi:HK97 family phage portal protein
MFRPLNMVRRFAGSVMLRAAKILGMEAGLYHALSSRSVGSSLAGISVNNDSSLKISAYKRGVELIASYIGKTPFHVKRNKRKDRQHPAWKLVRKWAQYHQLSAFEFRRTLVFLALTRGNGYAYIVRDPQTYAPTALRILDSGKVTPTLRAGSLYYKLEGRARAIASTDVIHIKGITKDGYVGLDPIKTYATDVLGLSLAQQQYASTYYAAGGSPSVYVYSPVSLDDDKFNRLRGQTGPLKRSLDNPHEIPVLDNAELRTLNLSAEQTQLLGSREFSLKDIANILNISVHKLNGEGTGGYKSVEEENNAFRDDTLDPWFVQFEEQYEKLLTEAEQETESHQIEAVRESLTRSNMTDRANYLQKAIGGPWMTPAEGRDVDSLEELDGTLELYPPPNMTKEDPNATPTDPAPAPAAKPKRSTGRDKYGDGKTDPDEHETPQRDHAAGELVHAGWERSRTLKQVAALEDTFSRMLKRLTVAARKAAEKPGGVAVFLNDLPARHADVIRSAFTPIVEVCGGEARDAEAITKALMAETRISFEAAVHRMASPDKYPETIGEACEQLERSAGRFARKALESWK